MVARGAVGPGQMAADVAELEDAAACGLDWALLHKVGSAQSSCGPYYAGAYAKHLSPTLWRESLPGLHHIQILVSASGNEDTKNCKVCPVHGCSPSGVMQQQAHAVVAATATVYYIHSRVPCIFAI